jgi:sugar/nucleoside kinase (ribokinase family)
MKEYDVLVAGEINPDLILSGDIEPEFGQVEKLIDSAELVIGSSSVIFACGAARLGLKVAFIGKCGSDLFGRFMLEEMSSRGIDTSAVIVDKTGKTGLSIILNRGGDRAILTQPGLIPALTANEIPDDLLEHSRHLHVASYYLQESLQAELPALFDRAHTFHATTSLDTNYDPDERWLNLDNLLTRTDVFLPNETEALALTCTKDIFLAAKKFNEQAKTVAIKRGATGALAMHSGKCILMPAKPVQVIDTVGAGDSFDAGFIYGYLNEWPIERSLQAAIICGAFSTRAMGGTAAQSTLEEVLRELP